MNRLKNIDIHPHFIAAQAAEFMHRSNALVSVAEAIVKAPESDFGTRENKQYCLEQLLSLIGNKLF
ncbi:hypothetical protein, partial [Methylomonas koyamae]|uniref:hypothetical protein n=1 Tax=Methylomonas koyamae TaxID=702114 RepID=UPI000AD459CE